MPRAIWRAAWACSAMLAVGCLAGQAAAASRPEVPLPEGVETLSEAQQVTIGATPLDVAGFTTTMSADAVRAFYERALPGAGWRMDLLPWQAHHAAVQREFREARGRSRDAQDDADMEAMGERLERTSQALTRQLYARHGDHHLVVNITTVGDRRIVFLNRWDGRASWMEMQPAQRVAEAPEAVAVPGAPAAWPLTNPCCSDESVADAEVRRILPTTIPRYPGARVLGTNRSADDTTRTLIMETPDDRTQVEQFYEKHLAYNGWTTVPGVAGEPLKDIALYQRGRTVCGLTFLSAPTVAEGTAGLSTLITIQVMEELDGS